MTQQRTYFGPYESGAGGPATYVDFKGTPWARSPYNPQSGIAMSKDQLAAYSSGPQVYNRPGSDVSTAAFQPLAGSTSPTLSSQIPADRSQEMRQIAPPPLNEPSKLYYPSIAEVVQNWKAGKYASRQDAIHALAQAWEVIGLSASEALTRANTEFDATMLGSTNRQPVGGTVTGAGTGTPRATPTPTSDPFGQLGGTAQLPGETLDDYYKRLAASAEGRNQLYNAGVRGRYANASNPFQEYLLSPQTQNTNEQQYVLQSATMPGGPTSYRKFVSDPGRGWLDPGAFEAGLQKIGDFLRNPTATQSAEMNPWREYMQEPTNQYNLALQAGSDRVPDAALPYYQRGAANAFKDFQVNTPGSTFLPDFISRGFRFW